MYNILEGVYTEVVGLSAAVENIFKPLPGKSLLKHRTLSQQPLPWDVILLLALTNSSFPSSSVLILYIYIYICFDVCSICNIHGQPEPPPSPVMAIFRLCAHLGSLVDFMEFFLR